MDNKVLHKFYLFVLIVEITMITVVQYSYNTEKVNKEKWKGVFMNSIISITESGTDSLYDWQNNHIIMIRGDM